jgi:ribosomal protein L15
MSNYTIEDIIDKYMTLSDVIELKDILEKTNKDGFTPTIHYCIERIKKDINILELGELKKLLNILSNKEYKSKADDTLIININEKISSNRNCKIERLINAKTTNKLFRK